jgi:4-amino-4-deoxy-L-arabinose transferase-like glycosyltransferase
MSREKKWTKTLSVFALVWVLFVALFYLFQHRYFLIPINPAITLSESLLYAGIMGAVLLGLAGGFYWLSRHVKFIQKSRGRLWQVMAMIFILMVSIAWARFIVPDRQVYHGPTLIYAQEGLVPYEGQSISIEQVALSEGMIVVSPEKKFLTEWQGLSVYFESMSSLQAGLNTASTLSKNLGLVLLIIWVMGLWGMYFRSFIEEEMDVMDQGLLVLGLGTLTMSMALWGLAWLGWLTIKAAGIMILLVSIAMVGHRRKTLNEWIKTLNHPFAKAWGELTLNEWVLWVFGGIMVSWNLIQLNSPFPSAHDDITYYMNMPRLLAGYGELIYGKMDYAFALIQSLGSMLSNTGSTALLLSGLFGIPAAIAIYQIINTYGSKKYSLLFGILTLSIPTIFYHSHLDVKVEMPLLFFGTMGLFYFLKWIQTDKKQWLVVSGLLMGFALSIKLTAAFLLPALGVMGLSHLALKKKRQWLVGVGTIGLFAGMVMLPNLHWMIFNAHSMDNFSIKGLVLNQDNPKPPISLEELGVDKEICSSLITEDSDLVRYSTDNTSPKWRTILTRPWDLTFYVSTRSPATDLGFLFLALCPLAFLYGSKSKIEKRKFQILGAGGITFWLLWMILGEGVIWYGITGMGFLFIWMVSGLELLNAKSKKISALLTMILIGWFVFAFLLRANWFYSRTQFLPTYLSGLVTTEQWIDNVYPQFNTLLATLNQDLDEKIIATADGSILYFIKENDKRVFRDQYLWALNCLYVERDDAQFLERLKQSEFTYLILSRPVKDPDFPVELFETSQDLLIFAQKHLLYVGGNQNIFLFKIPNPLSS